MAFFRWCGAGASPRPWLPVSRRSAAAAPSIVAVVLATGRGRPSPGPSPTTGLAPTFSRQPDSVGALRGLVSMRLVARSFSCRCPCPPSSLNPPHHPRRPFLHLPWHLSVYIFAPVQSSWRSFTDNLLNQLSHSDTLVVVLPVAMPPTHDNAVFGIQAWDLAPRGSGAHSQITPLRPETVLVDP
jgi:hypothetical protein